MADQKKPIDRKPYEKHSCQGRYMEPGRPWAGADDSGESLCMHCDVNQSCWSLTQERNEAKGERPQKERGVAATITIQIGNSDDHLTQRGWHDFVQALRKEVTLYWGDRVPIHFSGGAAPDAPWQNYCIVIQVPAKDLVHALQTWRLRLGRLAHQFRQHSIAMTVGRTEFVKAEA